MKKVLSLQLILLLGCGVDVPVSQVWSRFDAMDPEIWSAEIATRLAPFAEPKLTEAQSEYSTKFRVDGEFGRKFLWKMDADQESSEAFAQDPSGLLKICPRYLLLGVDRRAQVWTSILDALSFSETHYRESLTYPEKFKDSKGKPVISTGLFQVSQESANRHGGACEGATTEKLKDPNFNVMCAYRIMGNQIRRTGVLYYEDTRFYYWSTFSRGRNPKGFERFMGRLGQLMRDPERWPKACGLPANFTDS